MGKKSLFSGGKKYGYGYSSRGRKNTGPWLSAHDRHYQLESFKGVDNGTDDGTIIRVEGGQASSRAESKKGGNKSFGSVRVPASRNDSLEELTAHTRGNIYKETTVQRKVEIYTLDGNLAVAAHSQKMI